MKQILLLFLLMVSLASKAQKNESISYFDDEWKKTGSRSAQYLLSKEMLSDTSWQWDYYNAAGPMLRSEQTKDKDGKVKDGAVHYYNAKGLLDSTGVYKNGKRNGVFYKLRHTRDSIIYSVKYVYLDDALVESVDLEHQKDSSIRDTLGKESEFPGGLSAWRTYIQKNLVYPERAIKAKIQGDVKIGFIVDTVGRVHSTFIVKSVEYTLDKESVRIINGSGNWSPAFFQGKYVQSFKVQPIVYRLE